jgi:ATP-dependent Clp protease ATP-binding subunit ClpC
MFERYTENARRAIFFARYEASQFGASQIEAEHILLGIFREDKKLTARVLEPARSVESIRRELESRTLERKRIPTGMDLPLSAEAKCALAFASNESALLGDRHIGTEHLLLGILRTEGSIAAEVLYSHGLRLSDVRQSRLQRADSDEITQRFSIDASQPADPDARWLKTLSETGIDRGLFTQDELLAELAQVNAMREFGAETEALLRILAAKGLVYTERLPDLAFDLRDEVKLAVYIDKLRQM